jgi:hypothetical protein
MRAGEGARNKKVLPDPPPPRVPLYRRKSLVGWIPTPTSVSGSASGAGSRHRDCTPRNTLSCKGLRRMTEPKDRRPQKAENRKSPLRLISGPWAQLVSWTRYLVHLITRGG